MKKLAFLAIICVANAFTNAPEKELTKAERKFAADYFIKTKEKLLKDVEGLSEEQLNFKADSTRWSVAQCIEHIALAEGLLWNWTQSVLQKSEPQPVSKAKYTAQQLIDITIDRSHKFKAPEVLQPASQFKNSQQALQVFLSRRDSTLQYIKTTGDDLKNHFLTHPALGTLDLYQALLLLAAHSERHTLQIEEVMADPRFPKKAN